MRTFKRTRLLLPKNPEIAIKARRAETIRNMRLLFVLTAEKPRKIVKKM